MTDVSGNLLSQRRRRRQNTVNNHTTHSAVSLLDAGNPSPVCEDAGWRFEGDCSLKAR